MKRAVLPLAPKAWRAAAAAALLGAALCAPAARAGIFDDDEARRAILDIRQRIDQANERQKAGQADLTEQINQIGRAHV